EPISDYWIEVKIRKEERRRKKRFMVKRDALLDFLGGKDVGEKILSYNQENADPEVIRSLYRETQETILTLGLRPIFLVTYKRVAFQNGSERLSLDWDIQYYRVGTNVYSYDSWKYLVERPAGKAKKTFLEFKYPQGGLPEWIAELQRRYPIWERNYSKFVGGMWFLFQGQLSYDREADSFLQMIETYRGDCKLPLG
ncbi:MAG: VTC domain-containing protein, partial [Candidatus Hydrothermarchaeales archaeon]